MTQPKLADPILKVCKNQVRRGPGIESCGKKLNAGHCREKENHLLPFLTGFCDSGWHEGQKIDKPTCKFWVTCPCKCHTDISFMMNLAGQERTLVDNSTYTSGNNFVRVSLNETIQAAVVKNARVIPSQAVGITPALVVRDFAPTASGRAGRGELELWVRKVTDIWAVEGGKDCTPGYVSQEIAKMNGVKPPSTGAVDAVFKRWFSYGFALIGSSPTRFLAYTPQGIELGLEVLKARAKR